MKILPKLISFLWICVVVSDAIEEKAESFSEIIAMTQNIRNELLSERNKVIFSRFSSFISTVTDQACC